MTPIERVARALDPEIWERDAPFPTRYGTLEFHARRQASTRNARAVLQAIREPDGEIMQAGNRVWLDGGNERQIFEAMIDKALSE